MCLQLILFCLIATVWPHFALASSECSLTIDALDILNLKHSEIIAAQRDPDIAPRFSELARTLLVLNKKQENYYVALIAGLRQYRYNPGMDSQAGHLALVRELSTTDDDASILHIIAGLLVDIPPALNFGASFEEFDANVRARVPLVVHDFLEMHFSTIQGTLLAMASEHWELFAGSRPVKKEIIKIVRERVRSNYRKNDYEPLLNHYTLELFRSIANAYYSRLQSLQLDPAQLITDESLRFGRNRFDSHVERAALIGEILADVLIPGQDFSAKSFKRQLMAQVHRNIHKLIESLPQDAEQESGSLVIVNSTNTKGPSPRPGQRRRDRLREQKAPQIQTVANEVKPIQKIILTPEQKQVLDTYYKHYSDKNFVFKGTKALSLLSKLLGVPRNNGSSHYVFKFTLIDERIVVLDLHSLNSDLDPKRNQYVHSVIERYAKLSDFRD